MEYIKAFIDVSDIRVGDSSKIRDLSYPVAELTAWAERPEPYKAGK